MVFDNNNTRLGVAFIQNQGNITSYIISDSFDWISKVPWTQRVVVAFSNHADIYGSAMESAYYNPSHIALLSAIINFRPPGNYRADYWP